MLFTIFKIAIIILAMIYIGLKMNKGYKNAKRLETVCTQIVDANIIGLKQHHFLWGKYYQMECQYNYNGNIYTAKRGVFANINPETFKAVQLHINPQQPTETYYKTLNERCHNGGCCFVGCMILFVLLMMTFIFFVF